MPTSENNRSLVTSVNKRRQPPVFAQLLRYPRGTTPAVPPTRYDGTAPSSRAPVSESSAVQSPTRSAVPRGSNPDPTRSEGVVRTNVNILPSGAMNRSICEPSA
jgi:hypothetical protein